MRKKQFWIAATLLLSLPLFSLIGQSIAEKKANLKTGEGDLDQDMESLLVKVNLETQAIHARIQKLYFEVANLYNERAPEEEYGKLLHQINEEKHHLAILETKWRETAARSNRAEGYGLWHAPETTLEQLIIDYGSQDYVYLIPSDVGSIQLSVDSNLPIPRAAWSEMLELILSQNGVGIKTLNPYLRQLYLIKQNQSNLSLITNRREELEILPPEARASFVLSPEPSEVRRTFTFLEKFINTNTTVIQSLGRDILLIGPVGDLKELLKLYDFMAVNRGEKDYRLIPVYKAGAEEIAKILAAIFDQSETNKVQVTTDKNGGLSNAGGDLNGLKVVVLQDSTQALFVVGTREEVRKAEEIVANVENQIGGARDKTVFWYTVKHSDPEELADVLYRVYLLMVSTDADMDEGAKNKNVQNEVNVNNSRNLPPPNGQNADPSSSLYNNDSNGFVINPPRAEPGVLAETKANADRENFIVDAKTGAIVMVIEADLLNKIKELLRRLDVPKKMVQIETLLFEKILARENSAGMNLLKFGSQVASNHNFTGIVFNNLFPDGEDLAPGNAGVSEFFFSRKKSSGIPAFDLAYRFLLSQDDVQINSSPSILTINQTPATISINEDLSINTGAFEVEGGNTIKNAFTRAQYGITISVKPTIHLNQSDDQESDSDYVTLETDITFDTIQPGGDPSRPNVIRRHITNQVQVPDCDTVILGGLRRKISNDSRESIPFIGEIPGIGKLFSTSTLRDTSTEMFIFITPHIVKDPKEQLTCLRQELLSIRPGDVPYFLECVEEAHQYEKTRLFEGSMSLLFGRPRERYYIAECCKAEEFCGEYDGR